jgi:NAD(P)-dependent dehydrogenase (short-subunit alcohol dehydrogenase family)
MKTMLITGAANGLGATLAAAAVKQGYRVGLLDTDITAARNLANTLTDGVALHADVCDPQAVSGAIAELGAVDVCVNNAGILRTGPLIDHAPDDFRLVVDINLNGVFIVAQAAARVMRTRGGGVVINMASINGIHPSPNCGAYATAKGGVMALTQHMAIEWGQFGIRVNAVAPGFIDAGMSTPFYTNTAIRDRRASAVPLGRLGSAGDVADAVLFLASDAAAYISGQTLTVDGGFINSVLNQTPRE